MLLLTVAMHDTVTFSNGVFQRSLFIESKCTLSEIDVNGARWVMVPVIKQIADLSATSRVRHLRL